MIPDAELNDYLNTMKGIHIAMLVFLILIFLMVGPEYIGGQINLEKLLNEQIMYLKSIDLAIHDTNKEIKILKGVYIESLKPVTYAQLINTEAPELT